MSHTCFSLLLGRKKNQNSIDVIANKENMTDANLSDVSSAQFYKTDFLTSVLYN